MMVTQFFTMALSLILFTVTGLASPFSPYSPNVPAATITPGPVVPPAALASGAFGHINDESDSNGEYTISPSGHGSAIGGALDPSAVSPTDIGAIDPPPPLMTITFVNKHNMAVSTTHGRNAGAPAATSGNVAPGTMAVGATAAFAVPTNWAGRVAVAEARWGPLVNGRLATLLEANFNYAAGYGVAVPDFDVSYVDAYSVPMTCACNGKTLAGCNKALFSLHTCPAGDNHSGSCYNPLKADNHATAATAFFAPCSKAAYTYPNDHEANAYGVCQSAQVTCCIGAACPAGPKQS